MMMMMVESNGIGIGTRMSETNEPHMSSPGDIEGATIGSHEFCDCDKPTTICDCVRWFHLSIRIEGPTCEMFRFFME